MYLSSYTLLHIAYVCIIMIPWVPTDESTKKHTNTTPNFSINFYSNLYTVHIHSHHIRIINITIFLCIHTIKYKHTKNRVHIHHHRKLSSTFPGILESLTTQPWENFVIENDSKMRIAAVRLSKDEYVPKKHIKKHCHTMAKCCVSALKKPLSLTSFYRNFAVGRDTWYWLDTPIRLALVLHVDIFHFHVSLIWVFACFASIGFVTELKIIKWKIAFSDIPKGRNLNRTDCVT